MLIIVNDKKVFQADQRKINIINSHIKSFGDREMFESLYGCN